MAEKPDTDITTRKLVNPIADRGEPEVYIDIAGVEHSRPVTESITRNGTPNGTQDAPEEPKDLPMELDGV